jgi:hypothetical protein
MGLSAANRIRIMPKEKNINADKRGIVTAGEKKRLRNGNKVREASFTDSLIKIKLIIETKPTPIRIIPDITGNMVLITAGRFKKITARAMAVIAKQKAVMTGMDTQYGSMLVSQAIPVIHPARSSTLMARINAMAIQTALCNDRISFAGY